MKPIVEIQNISKQFFIDHERTPYYSFRDRLGSLFKTRPKQEEFWALKEISFDIAPGESVGIIGRNGAGKSTLLKILSKITPPTKGKIIARGRIASLLEVGTGFHQELTGRENIFMNGSILGMKKTEIKARFDEIVDFSGVEKFLDTPLKHYSSGMQLRLAFAVAAHLEPEIMIIDEVLAVGDSVFQAKCIQKMSEISSSGRTILFVSHNLALIRNLCHRALVLKNGNKVFDGESGQAIDFYGNLSIPLSGSEIDLSLAERKIGKKKLLFDKIFFDRESYEYGQPIVVKIKLKSMQKTEFTELDFGINFVDRNEVCLTHLSNKFISIEINHSSDDVYYQFKVQNLLRPGIYKVTLFLRTREEVQDYLLNAVQFEVLDGNPYHYPDSSSIQGAVFPIFSFEASAK